MGISEVRASGLGTLVYELDPHIVEGIKEGYKRNLKRKTGLVHLIP